jgi:hypothetical protein
MNPATLTQNFRAAVEQIRQQPWFTAGNWTIQNSDGESWTGLQLSKPNWFNEDGHGIHFETWLSDDVVRDGMIRFQCHVMHSGMTFPGTDKKAAALSRPILARHKEFIQSLGFRPLPAGGMTLLDARVPITEAMLTEVVVSHCEKFSQLGEAIDEILACILEGRKIPSAPRKPKSSTGPVHFGDNLVPGWGGDGSPWTCRAVPKVHVELSIEPDGTLRADVTGKAAKNHDAIVSCDGLRLEAGKRYQGLYEVKAAVPRWMTGGIRQSEAPHLGAGEFKGRNLTEEWQTVSWEFTATRDEEDAEILFAIGKVPNTVWFRRVEVREAE